MRVFLVRAKTRRRKEPKEDKPRKGKSKILGENAVLGLNNQSVPEAHRLRREQHEAAQLAFVDNFGEGAETSTRGAKNLTDGVPPRWGLDTFWAWVPRALPWAMIFRACNPRDCKNGASLVQRPAEFSSGFFNGSNNRGAIRSDRGRHANPNCHRPTPHPEKAAVQRQIPPRALVEEAGPEAPAPHSRSAIITSPPTSQALPSISSYFPFYGDCGADCMWSAESILP